MKTIGFLAEPLAIVNPSNATATPAAIAQSTERLWRRHAKTMPFRERRCFAAALAIERAGACFRAGQRWRAAYWMLRSIICVPIGNKALQRVIELRMS